MGKAVGEHHLIAVHQFSAQIGQKMLDGKILNRSCLYLIAFGKTRTVRGARRLLLLHLSASEVFMAEPTIDVVIPLYNMQRFVEAAIRSVQEQTFSPGKIIVVDDGSTDEGPLLVSEMARDDPRIILLSGPNQGLSAARNKGIATSTASHIAFLDSDDIWLPEKLERQHRCLQSNPNASFVHCGAGFIDEAGRLLENCPPRIPEGSPSFNAIRLGDYAVTGSASAVVARKDLLEKIGGFTLPLRRGEDWDVWAKLAEAGPVEAVDAVLTLLRTNLQSATRGISALEAAKSRLYSRAAVAENWKGDARFMEESRERLRKEAWYAARWLLWNPAGMKALYHELRDRPSTLVGTLFTGPADFIFFLIRGIASTARDMLKPGEAWRIFRRFSEEKAHSSKRG
ncbi:glycosyltransferase family A protein [Desulfocurvibacter africanus]|uniref:glycosyltransferase family 2 protein n=1 Tax=Desulfocurvibacter africanus TaxID=873 RepID=UPI002FDA6E3C